MIYLETILHKMGCRGFGRFVAAACMVVLLLLAGSCTDDPFAFDDGERVPVKVSLKVEVPNMNVITRAEMQDGMDKRVETLWIGIYNANTGERTGSTIVDNPETADHNNTTVNVDVETKTGPSYIVAVANYSGLSARTGESDTNMDLIDALYNAKTWKEYNAISVLADPNGKINTDLPLSALPMSGHYMAGNHADGRYTDVETVNIPRDGNLGGKIHLRRLISHISFNIDYNINNISNFEILGWSVHNVPNQSWVAEQTTGTLNAGDVYGRVNNMSSFQNTVESNYVEKTGNTLKLDWWQLENKRTGRAPQEDGLTGYNYREQEYKNADGTNSGKYVSLVESATSTDANNNASFLQMRVRMTMKVDEEGNELSSNRTVDAVYTVHLGYCEGADEAAKARDFYSRRNTKYTYKVKVNNINDILVEAKKEGEKVPGAEGIITDITNSFQQLDAHYGVYNVYLSANEITNFEYLIRCYDENNNLVLIDSSEESTVPASGDKRKYLDWVEIRPTTDANTLSAYKPHSDKDTYTLDEFRSGLRNGTLGAGDYTVFFNEYVYENSTGSTDWRNYVNKPDRQLWFRVEESRSPDGESTYFKAKYAFSQRSIQTFYSTETATEALGVEHLNESYGLNLRTSNDLGETYFASPHYKTTDNGRYNAARFIAGGDWSSTANYQWSNFVAQATAQSVNAISNQGVNRDATTHALPALKAFTGASESPYDPDLTTSRKYIDARNACMNRNRDLDGDGYIDANELRWFIPSGAQAIRVILGRQSLATPIMDYANNSTLNNTNNGLLPSLMLYCSDGKSIWCMEGTSTSKWNDRKYSGYPWNVRCVRFLGVDISNVVSDRTVQTAYVHEGNTVRMTYYDDKSVRNQKLLQMIPHDIADQDYNRCYRAFEYSSNQISIANLNGYATYSGNWVDWLKNLNPCSGVTGLTGTGWRIPNQKEITIMLNFGIIPTGLDYLASGTFSHYNNSGVALSSKDDLSINNFKVMCTTINKTGTQMSFSDLSGNFAVRCVRDID